MTSIDYDFVHYHSLTGLLMTFLWWHQSRHHDGGYVLLGTVSLRRNYLNISPLSMIWMQLSIDIGIR